MPLLEQELMLRRSVPVPPAELPLLPVSAMRYRPVYQYVLPDQTNNRCIRIRHDVPNMNTCLWI